MSVTKEDVVACYRQILGRNPESEINVQWHVDNQKNLEGLIGSFLRSEEYLQKQVDGIVTGKNLDFAEALVDISVDGDQLDAMFNYVSTCWQEFGEEEPHWSVLTQPEFKADSLSGNLTSFYESGRQWAGIVLATLTRNRVDPAAIHHVTDFGCGVGRMTLGLAEKFEAVTGVDISPPHLRHAQARAAEIGCTNVDFVPLVSVEAIDRLPETDFFFSVIVLQHNPPPVMASMLEKLMARVRPNGVAMFQIPTFSRNYRFDSTSYLAGSKHQMEMHVLPQSDLFSIAAKKGFVPLEVREDNFTGDRDGVSQTFLFRREK